MKKTFMRLRTIFFAVSICSVCVEGPSINRSLSDRSLKNPPSIKLNEHAKINSMKNEIGYDDGGNYDDDDSMMNSDDGNDDDGDDFENDMDDEDNDSKAEENLGLHYFQGDVLTTNDQMRKIRHLLFFSDSATGEEQAVSRALIKDVRRTWKNGVLPYKIKENVDKTRREIIRKAIDHWENNTCLRFVTRKDEKDYVEFEQGKGCASYVGRIGGMQSIEVGNKNHRCKVGNIIHEIGHSIGFFHEQSRPDRDKYVEIKWDNVMQGLRVNFVRFSKSIIDSRDVEYDYGSIMHYPRKIFGKKSSKPTIVPVKDPVAHIGQRIALSRLDILQVEKMYNCINKSVVNQIKI